MSKVVWDVTMSLDGFTSGPNVRADEPMGGGGVVQNRADGVMHNRVGDLVAPYVKFLAPIVNEGLLEFAARDESLVKLGDITNSGTLRLEATEDFPPMRCRPHTEDHATFATEPVLFLMT